MNVDYTVTEVLVSVSYGKMVFDRTFRWKRISFGEVMLIWPFWRFGSKTGAHISQLRKAAE